MSMLQWNETDLMNCLEVFPTIDEHSLYHEFAVEEGDLRLSITIQQYEGTVLIRLVKADLPEPLFEMPLRSCVFIRHTVPADGTPDFLEFVTGYKQSDNAMTATGVHIFVRPQIRIVVL
jgi:hypothetical protein